MPSQRLKSNGDENHALRLTSVWVKRNVPKFLAANHWCVKVLTAKDSSAPSDLWQHALYNRSGSEHALNSVRRGKNRRPWEGFRLCRTKHKRTKKQRRNRQSQSFHALSPPTLRLVLWFVNRAKRSGRLSQAALPWDARPLTTRAQTSSRNASNHFSCPAESATAFVSASA
jgi:hypothetical protein